MILIFSYSGDYSTDLVIEWLNYYHHPVYRLNSSDLYNLPICIDVNNNSIQINNSILKINNINAIWFRKFGLKRDFELFKTKEPNFIHCFQLHEEHEALFNTLYYLFKDKFWLTNPHKVSLNKIEILLTAQKAGLNIPSTYIINNSKDVENIIKKNKYIFKSISDAIFINENTKQFSMYTKKINKYLIKKYPLPKLFSASLIQERIQKEFEIRVFYLCGKCYSMAIFSQNDPKTVEDFRNYNWKYPNRMIPYQLPKSIEKKISHLMKSIDLNCGSIDMLKSFDENFYFLEINPVGQFGMVDFPCNYNLHHKIALELIKQDIKHG